LKAELERDDLFVEADGNKISIALGNLVKNSIMFSDEVAESVEGKGSTFSFLLPINATQAEAGSRVFMP